MTKLFHTLFYRGAQLELEFVPGHAGSFLLLQVAPNIPDESECDEGIKGIR